MLGAGLLVGKALAIIIPEGVHVLYESEDHGKTAFGKIIAASTGGQLSSLHYCCISFHLLLV